MTQQELQNLVQGKRSVLQIAYGLIIGLVAIGIIAGSMACDTSASSRIDRSTLVMIGSSSR
jgi:Flp pilus assembly pilin Flp